MSLGSIESVTKLPSRMIRSTPEATARSTEPTQRLNFSAAQFRFPPEPHLYFFNSRGMNAGGQIAMLIE